MRLRFPVLAMSLCLGSLAFAQQPSQNDSGPGPDQIPPHSNQQQKDRDAEAGQSSSRDTRIDLSPPKNDVKNHPNSGVSDTSPEDDIGDVHEMHPWNPYRALKDDEVADFYFKRRNYHAALARYQDALAFKEHDAVANFGMAQCYEKLNQPAEAIHSYQEYLKILPHGPLSNDARKAMERLGAAEKSEAASPTQAKQ